MRHTIPRTTCAKTEYSEDEILEKCRHACYNACMKSIQYTIRNVPPATDRRLRKLAKISGKSLTQVVLDRLDKNSGRGKSKTLLDSLDWFIGGNRIDEATYRAWEEDDKIQKELTRKQWVKDDN